MLFWFIIFWPIRFLIKFIGGKKPEKKSNIDRIVIIGLDGMDPVLAEKYLKEEKLPNFKKLRTEGSFRKLKTTTPAISPVAWSSFITGVDPSRHCIFDFLNRDLRSYKPVLSSSKVEKPSRYLSLGKYSIPLKSGKVKMLRKGIPFWNILGKYNIFSSILRVPITFPPEKFNGTTAFRHVRCRTLKVLRELLFFTAQTEVSIKGLQQEFKYRLL